MANTKIIDLTESLILDANAVIPVVDFIGWVATSRKVKANAIWSWNGTVTSVSVTTANGVSGSVATATTTPAITLTLWAITPTTTNGLIVTANWTNTLNIAAGKTLKCDNTLTFTGTDSSTLAIWTWWTLGTAAYTAATAYATSTQGTAADNALPKAGWTMTGKTVSAGRDEVWKIYTPATWSQTVALDCAVNNVHIVTGHTDGTAITFTVANATNSQCFIVSILQGSGTVSTIAARFNTVRRAWGSAPTLTATLNKRDTFGFIRTWTNTYDGFIIWQNC